MLRSHFSSASEFEQDTDNEITPPPPCKRQIHRPKIVSASGSAEDTPAVEVSWPKRTTIPTTRITDPFNQAKFELSLHKRAVEAK